MRFEFTLGTWRIRASAERQVRVRGVTSELSDGNHMLLWDFDNTDLSVVCADLKRVQAEYNLPTIHILRTRESSYHAYCFARHSWPWTLLILADTPHLDPDYFRIGVWRGYFTLRIAPKPGAPEIEHVTDLVSGHPADINPLEANRFVRYWTHA